MRVRAREMTFYPQKIWPFEIADLENFLLFYEKGYNKIRGIFEEMEICQNH